VPSQQRFVKFQPLTNSHSRYG